MAKKIFISCGELSGEQHAAKLVEALFRKDAQLEIYAFGSKLIESSGAKLVIDYKDYSFSGFSEVVKNLSKILKIKDLLSQKILELKPDLVVLVDYGAFNLELAKTIRQDFATAKLPSPKIIEFIAPQIWASRPWRIHKIKANVDKVLCTLPFEEAIYNRANIPVKYVGNPVATSLEEKYSKELLYNELGLKGNPSKEILIGVFPGSRKSEIQYMYPLMQGAAEALLRKNPEYKLRFLLAQAPNLNLEIFNKYSGKEIENKNLITILDPNKIDKLNHKLLSASDCLWLCSGTVTLEAALYGVPYFLAYKSNFLNYILYLIFRTTTMAGLANIISGKYIIKEFLQYDANVENFVTETQSWLTLDGFSEYYYKIKTKLEEFRQSLIVEDTFGLVADVILAE